MNINDISQTFGEFFTGPNLVRFFFKAFSISASIIFFIYTIVIHKQVEEVTKTVTNHRHSILVFVSFIQIFVVLCLVLFALFFL